MSMYRAGSFASSSQYSIKSSLTSDGKDRDGRPNDDPRTVYLKSKGKLPMKTVNPTTGGRMLTFCNYPVRNRQWSMEAVVFHPISGSFAIADERGQLFYMSIEHSLYQSVRFASSKISSICFLPYQKAHLMVAYDNGSNVIVDASTTDIVGNFQFPFSYGAVRFIVAHPKDPLVAIVQGNFTVILWNLREGKCTETLECPELIVDLSFEMAGKYIAVCLERAGVFLYAARTLHLACQLTCELPSSRAVWSSFVCIPHRTYWQSEGCVKSYLQVLISSSEASLHSAFVEDLSGENQEMKCHSFVTFPLPPRLDGILSLVYLGCAEGSSSPRVLALGRAGDILILQSDHAHENSPGFLTILADLAADVTQQLQVDSPSAARAYPQRCNGRQLCGAAGDHVVLIGSDGAARMFKTKAMCAGGSGGLQGQRLSASVPGSQQAVVSSQLEKQGSMHRVNSAGMHSKSFRSSHDKDAEKPMHSQRSMRSAEHMTVTRHDPVPPAAEAPIPRGESLYDFYLNDDDDMGLHEHEDEGNETPPARMVTTKTHTHTTTTTTKTKASSMQRTSSAASMSSRTSKGPHKVVQQVVRTPVHSFVTGDKISTRFRAGLQAVDLKNTPLFELAALTPKEQRVNQLKLRAFLEKHGEFPSRYRSLIWRFLLKLPENAEAFSDLVSRGVHPAFEDLEDRYPIAQRKLFLRLQSVCSQLAHWAPILAEAKHLPSMVFPFLLVYGPDDLATLETVLSIYMYWGASWHTSHPNPPQHLLAFFADAIKLHEVKLYDHLMKYNVPPGVLCWHMVANMFTEVCSRSAWLKLMDHLFAEFDRTSSFVLAPVVLIKEMKEVLMVADTDRKIMAAVHQQQPFKMDQVIRAIGAMKAATPDKYFNAVATRHLNAQNYEMDLRRTVMMTTRTDDVLEAERCQALSNGRPVFPLPKGKYPVYDGYPRHLMDVQIKERERVMGLSKEVQRRENVLKKLEKRVMELEVDHKNYLKSQKQLVSAEMEQRREVMTKEKAYLAEMQRVEEEVALQRLRGLDVMEGLYKEEVQALEEVVQQSKEVVSEVYQHMQVKLDTEMALQKHRELAEKAEVATMEKMRAMRIQRARDEWTKNLSSLLQTKEEEFAAQDTLLAEQWRTADDEARSARLSRQLQRQQAYEIDQMSRAQREVLDRMRVLDLQRASKVQEIERQRAVRLAQEQCNDALEAAERAALFAKQQEVLARGQMPPRGLEDELADVRTEEAGGAGAGANEQADGLRALTQGPLREAEAALRETIAQVQGEARKLLDAERIYTLKKQQNEASNRQKESTERVAAEVVAAQAAALAQAQKDLSKRQDALRRASARMDQTLGPVSEDPPQWQRPMTANRRPATSRVIDLEASSDCGAEDDEDLLEPLDHASAKASKLLRGRGVDSDEDSVKGAGGGRSGQESMKASWNPRSARRSPDRRDRSQDSAPWADDSLDA